MSFSAETSGIAYVKRNSPQTVLLNEESNLKTFLES